MGQRAIKQTRKIAEKTAKTMALELAKSQIMDIANSPWSIRWAFCKAILFPKKLRVTKEQHDAYHKKSFGIDIPDMLGGDK